MAERTFSSKIKVDQQKEFTTRGMEYKTFLSIVTPEYHETSENSTPDKIPSLPAIFLEEVLDMQSMISSLEKVVKKENYSLKANNDKVKILPKNADAYKKIVKQLKTANARFHIYQFKQDRTFKVVLRNIHHSANMVELKEELLLLGYEILNISNVKPPYKKKREIVQCKRCQQYGHTQRYCNSNFRCVKCSGYHLTIVCMKPANIPVKCALCEEGDHPANYRGCLVHKKLQQNKFPRQRPKILPNQPTVQHHSSTSLNKVKFNCFTTYAEAVKRFAKEHTTNADNSASNNLNIFIQSMGKSLSRLEQILIKHSKQISNNQRR
ncbi:hypothetical protein HZH68_016148 [Vespula germanica]|uniref:Nucleic-acid-binding protein from transposon X-element n=1 Tax=Vespula germanica TaxID=30212 RepID=A0A834MSG6_VESGE|nr:hypothetical protein HZH68_016148 [Vespula germanica]